MRRKVLVADASETIIAVCRKLLTQHGYDAALFQDGTRALEELKKTAYDLAVISTTTENVSGYFIVKELRKDRVRGQVPILMLLGSSELLDTRELVEVAPDDTLSKPFSPQELLHKIDKLLERGSSAPAQEEEEVDIESILTDDEKSFDKKISSATDKIFLSMLKQNAGEIAESAPSQPQIDRLELPDNPYDVEAATPPRPAPEDTPHDYDWFVSEMTRETAPPQEQVQPPTIAPTGSTSKFEIEEIGTSKLSVDQLRRMQTTAEDKKTKVYIEKLQAPLVSEVELGQPSVTAGTEIELQKEFVRSFAEALAKEIVRNIDLEKLVQRIDKLMAVKQEK